MKNFDGRKQRGMNIQCEKEEKQSDEIKPATLMVKHITGIKWRGSARQVWDIEKGRIAKYKDGVWQSREQKRHRTLQTKAINKW